MYQIILASESPRRSEIMETMGIPFQVMASNVVEVVTETNPDKIVEELAALKVNHIADKLNEAPEYKDHMIIIGADTMVFYQGEALGKPKDKDDAHRMLKMLSGHEHEVYTGVCVIIKKDQREEEVRFSVCTKVIVHDLTKEQIDDYIASKEPMDKAGAYGIQGKFAVHIKGIIGDYYNVMGLPISELYYSLLKKGIDIKK